MRAVFVLAVVLLLAPLTNGMMIDDFSECIDGPAFPREGCHDMNFSPPRAGPGQWQLPWTQTSQLDGIDPQRTIGGERDIEVYVTAGSGSGRFIISSGKGGLSWNCPAQSLAQLKIFWDGPDAGSGSEGIQFRGLGGVDITEQGIRQAVRILLGDADVPALVTVTFYTDETHYSNLAFDPGEVENTENSIPVFIQPFNDLTTPPEAEGPADLADIGAIVLTIDAAAEVDMTMLQIETVSLVELTKTFEIVQDVNSNGVAEPGERIRYDVTLTATRSAYAFRVNDILFYDNPSLAQPWLALVSPIPALQASDFISGTPGEPIPDRQVLRGNTAGDTSIAILIDHMEQGDQFTFHFFVDVLPSLPCCLPDCDYVPETPTGLPAGCQVTGQNQIGSEGHCHCAKNQAFACLELDSSQEALRNEIINNGPGDYPCVPSNDVSSQPDLDPSSAPITGSSDPTVVSKTRVGTGAIEPGDTLTFEITVDNIGTRQSAAQRLIDVLPAGATFEPEGSSSGWTCTSTQCVMDIGPVEVNTPTAYRIVLTLPSSVACNTNEIVNLARIERSPSETCTCKDINLNNNQQSVTLPLASGPDLAITKSRVGANPIFPGDTITYRLDYSNSGNVDAEGAEIIETVPERTRFSSTSNEGGRTWSCVPSQGLAGAQCTLSLGSIPSGGSGQATFAVIVDSPLPCDTTPVTNTVTIANACGDRNSANNQDTIQTPVGGEPVIELNKVAGAERALPGSTITYTLSFRNVGNRNAIGAQLQDQLPARTTLAPGQQWSCNQGTCTLDIGDLPVSPTFATRELRVVVDSVLPCDFTSVSNTATLINTCELDPIRSVSDSETTPIDGLPDLRIQKTANEGSIAPGATATFNIAVSNRGSRDATNAVITDIVPAGTTFVAGSSTEGWDCSDGAPSGTECHFTVGSIPAEPQGSTPFRTVTFTVRLQSGIDCDFTNFDNTASISNDCGESGGTAPSSTANVGINAFPDLSITGELSHTVVNLAVVAQRTISTLLRYQNHGRREARNAIITVTHPLHTTFAADSSDPEWECNAATRVCTKPLGTIAALGNGEALFAFTVDGTVDCDVDQLSLNAEIAGACPNFADSNPSNNLDVDTFSVVADTELFITKDDHDAEFRQGSTVVYDITYGNEGLREATGVQIVDVVPQHTTFNPLESSAEWICDATPATAGTSCRITVGDLPPQSSTSAVSFALTLNTVFPRELEEVVNTVTITTTCGDDSAQATEPTPVVGKPELELNKTDDDITAPAGGVIVYRLDYRNTGSRDATGVVITETVPANTHFEPDSSTAGWTCSGSGAAGSACTYNHPGSLPVTGTFSVDFAVRVDETLLCGVTSTSNRACISEEDGDEEDLSNNCGNDVTPLTATPNLAIIKDDARDFDNPAHRARPNDIILYTINYANNGNREARDVVITETVPDYTVFSAFNSRGGWNCVDGAVAGTTCSIQISSLLAGESAATSPVFAVRVVKPFPFGVTETVNTVTIENSCGEADSTDNTNSHPTPLIGLSDLVVQKHGFCESIEWVLNFANVGNKDAREVTITEYVPGDTVFNAELSDSRWECTDATAGSECLLRVGYVEAGEGGSVVFVTDPLKTAKAKSFINTASIDDLRGDDPDPTPENNHATDVIGLKGCAACDSCCPPVDECCPDRTDVLFNFGGVLDGLRQCHS